jgi:uncharacterized protein DUF11
MPGARDMKPVSTLLALLAGLALFVSGAHAAQNAWTVTGPNGGRTWEVAYHPTQPGVILISTSRGMYRTTDGGQHWTLSAGITSAMVGIAFDPTNPNRVFTANNALWRSDDGGQSFAAVPGAPGIRLLGIGSNGQLFVADGGGEVSHTSDQGQHWTHATRPWPATPGSQAITSLGVDPNTPGTVYVGVQGYGIYKSSNSGASWSTPAPGPGTGTYTTNTIAVKPGDSSRVLVAANDGVYRSIDGGTSWTRVTAMVAAHALAINPDIVNTDEVMAVGDFDNRVIRSTDGGATFPFRGASLLRLGTNRMAFDPHGPGRVMMASDDGPLLSIDDGDNFEALVEGIHSESSARFAASDDGTIYAIFGNGPNHVYMRNALGWHALDPTSLRAHLFSYAPWFREVETAPLDSDVVYVVPRLDYLLKSVDGGTTWSGPDVHFAGQGREIAKVVVDPTATNTVYVTTGTQGVWRTDNGGISWTQRRTGLPSAIGPLTVDRANANVLYAGGSVDAAAGVYKSTNAGVSWLATGALPAESVIDIVIDPANSDIVYALTRGHAFRSTNGGTSWTAIDFGDVSPQAVQSRSLFIDPLLPSTLIFSSALFSGGFMRSVDSGATWENIAWPEGLNFAGAIDAAVVDPLRPSSVITNGYGTGVLEYEVAPDLALEISGIVPPLATETTVNGTLTVRNLGPNAASNAVATAVLPSWLTVAVPPGCSLSVRTLTCTTGPIRRNQVVSFPLALSVGATPSTGQITATLSTHEPDPNSSNNTRIVPLASTLQNSFELGITTPATVVDHGDRVRFVLTGRNLGPSPATDTRIVLPLGQFELVSINSSGGSPTCSVNGSMVITCTYQRIAAGATVTVTVTTDAEFIGANALEATMTGDGDTTTAGVGITARPVADFSVTAQGPAVPITVGASYQYSIAIHNNGPDAAPMGASAFFDLATTSGVTVNGVACTRFAVSLECFTASLAANATATIVVDVLANGPGAASASVNVYTDGTDRVSPNNAATAAATQRLVGNASVTLGESADPVTTNTAFSYTANVRNAGPNESTIHLSVPVTGATVTSVTGPALSTCSNSAQNAVCDLRLASGASADVVIALSAPTAGAVTATATVEYTGFDPDTTNNTATVSTTANAPPPPPPPPSGSSSSSSGGGGGGGGGRFDWLAALLLGGLLWRRVARTH